MALEGTTNTGEKRIIGITVDDFANNTYGGYDTFVWTNNLDAETPNVSKEGTTSLISDMETIRVFDTDVVKVGALITYTKADGTRVDGVVSSVSAAGDKIAVTTVFNGKAAAVVLTLIDATMNNFAGEILGLTYS
jgi:hypothetical protein